MVIWLYVCAFIGGIINRTWEERMEAKNIINSKFGGFEYMDNNKEMIEGLVSQILDDYHDDKS